VGARGKAPAGGLGKRKRNVKLDNNFWRFPVIFQYWNSLLYIGLHTQFEKKLKSN